VGGIEGPGEIATYQNILAAAIKHVGASPAHEHVIAQAAAEDVVAAFAVNYVPPRSAHNGVSAVASVNFRISARPGHVDVIIAVQAIDDQPGRLIVHHIGRRGVVVQEHLDLRGG